MLELLLKKEEEQIKYTYKVNDDIYDFDYFDFFIELCEHKDFTFIIDDTIIEPEKSEIEDKMLEFKNEIVKCIEDEPEENSGNTDTKTKNDNE